MENTYVTEETLIGEIVRDYPEVVDVLYAIGMHCIGCPASQAESLADACRVHGFEPAEVTNVINERIAAAKQEA